MRYVIDFLIAVIYIYIYIYIGWTKVMSQIGIFLFGLFIFDCSQLVSYLVLFFKSSFRVVFKILFNIHWWPSICEWKLFSYLQVYSTDHYIIKSRGTKPYIWNIYAKHERSVVQIYDENFFFFRFSCVTLFQNGALKTIQLDFETIWTLWRHFTPIFSSSYYLRYWSIRFFFYSLSLSLSIYIYIYIYI